MKHIKPYNESIFGTKKDGPYTKDEIEDFFLEYIEDGKGEVTEGFISSKDNRYFTDVANVSEKSRKCIKVDITLEGVSTGVKVGMMTCLTNIDILTNLLTKIKSFYKRTELDPNFAVIQKFNNRYVEFYIPGEVVETGQLKTKEEINTLLTELLPIIKKMNYKRVELKGSNWLEVKVTTRRDEDSLYYQMRGGINGQYAESPIESRVQLHNWCQKVQQSGYRIKIGGGDKQTIFSLEKI